MMSSHEASPKIPIEIEIYLNPDGSVTFADLEEHIVPLARDLDPDSVLACDVPASTPDAADQEQVRGQATRE